MAEDNTILVGSKLAMNYVLAVITQFNSSSKKVDVAEIVRNKFLPKIKISTDIRGTEGWATNISAIEIDLA